MKTTLKLAVCMLCFSYAKTAPSPEDSPDKKDGPKTPEEETTTTLEPTSSTQTNTTRDNNCTCVPYLRCKTAASEEDLLVSVIFSELNPCEDLLDVCCGEENILPLTDPSQSSALSPPPQVTGQNVTQNCTCTKYYLCQKTDDNIPYENTCENYLDVCCSPSDVIIPTETTTTITT